MFTQLILGARTGTGRRKQTQRASVAKPESNLDDQQSSQIAILKSVFPAHMSVVLTHGQFCTPGDIWQNLETLLVVTKREMILASSG